MIKPIAKIINAREFLTEIGISQTITNGGPAKVLTALHGLGIKPIDQKVHGAGVSFFISAEDRDAYINKSTANRNEETTRPTRLHHKIRTVARSLLQLYELLGEEATNLDDLKKVADK
jgi:hypothetical protein